MSYPPDDHILRDLRTTSWLEADDHAVAEMPVDVAVLDRTGAASLGALVTLVDVCCARVGLRAAPESWIGTADLSLHLSRPLPSGSTARVDAWLLKAGSKLISVAADLAGAGRGVVSFARIPREASLLQPSFGGIGERSTMERTAPPLEVGIDERMGLRHVDGGVELDRHPYVGNSFGTINGGVMGLLVTAAAEAVTGGVGSDLTLRYHGQTKVGPARATASLLRPDVCEVRVLDVGADDLLLATGYVFTARADG